MHTKYHHVGRYEEDFKLKRLSDIIFLRFSIINIFYLFNHTEIKEKNNCKKKFCFNKFN